MANNNEEFIDAIFQHLLETGAIVLKGMNPQGEPVYSITEKCREIFPEFYDMHMSSMNTIAYELWDMGVVEIIFGDEGEKVSFNEENHAKLLEVQNSLSQEHVEFLQAMGVEITYEYAPGDD